MLPVNAPSKHVFAIFTIDISTRWCNGEWGARCSTTFQGHGPWINLPTWLLGIVSWFETQNIMLTFHASWLSEFMLLDLKTFAEYRLHESDWLSISNRSLCLQVIWCADSLVKALAHSKCCSLVKPILFWWRPWHGNSECFAIIFAPWYCWLWQGNICMPSLDASVDDKAGKTCYQTSA